MAKSVDLSNAFAGAGQAQTIHNLKNRVEELETEISQLKVAGINSDEKAAMEARIQELVTELAAKEGIQEVQVELIERNYLQPRQSFPQHLIQAMAELLKNEGQHTPVILIPQTDGRYLLFDGERRWRAAKLLGWKAIKAVILLENSQLDREELRRKALSTTLHREDLHPLDLAEVLVAEIVYRYPYLQTQSTVTVSIPRILNTAISRLERNGKAAELAELAIASLEIQKEWLEVAGFKACEEADILGIILGLQLNPASVDSNIMPMLKLTEDLKTSVRESGLEASKARLLNQLSAERLNLQESAALTIRTQATNQVIQSKLSVSKTRGLVKTIIAEHTKQEITQSVDKKVTKAIESIRNVSAVEVARPQLEELYSLLQEKLGEIKSALEKTQA